MASYAVVKNGVVENMILYDGVAELSIADSELIKATEFAKIGSLWDGNVFTAVEPTPRQPTEEQVAKSSNKASAKSKLVALGLSEDEISAAFGI